MIGAPIFKDIFKYKPKFMGRLTGRQALLDGLGIAFIILILIIFGIPQKTNQELPVYLLIVLFTSVVKALFAIPFFLFAHFEPYGMPLEKFIKKAVIPYFKNPSVRKGEDLKTDPVSVKRRRHPAKVKRSKTYKAIM